MIFSDWPHLVASFEKDTALNVFTFTLMIIGLALLSLYKVSKSFATLI